MYSLLFLVILTFPSPSASNFTSPLKSCCKKVTGNCRSYCDEIMTHVKLDSGISMKDLVLKIQDLCSPETKQLWNCLEEVYQNEEQQRWIGSICCHLAETEPCRQACLVAHRQLDLTEACQPYDEVLLYECVELKQKGEECCRGARNSQCFNDCRKAVSSRRLNRSARDGCQSVINSCINSFYKAPTYSLSHMRGCCEMSSSPECTLRCNSLMESGADDRRIIRDLQLNRCGADFLSPDINANQDGMWRCFDSVPGWEEVGSLKRSDVGKSFKNVVKGHCCLLAKGKDCKALCQANFYQDNSRFKDFNDRCLMNDTQKQLVFCTDSGEETCELGCEGLEFCTMFNGRWDTMFRSCDIESDEAARRVINEISSRRSITIGGFTLEVKSIEECAPLMWKTVVCGLLIKPCTQQTHSNSICRESCHNLLRNCLVGEEAARAATRACQVTPASHQEACVDLGRFIDGRPLPAGPHRPQAHPCAARPRSCQNPLASHCSVNRTHLVPNFSCVNGCRLGDMAETTVPVGTFVSVVSSLNHQGDTAVVCRKGCECTGQLALSHCWGPFCQPMETCYTAKTDLPHGNWTVDVCMKCVCHFGELVCQSQEMECLKHREARDKEMNDTLVLRHLGYKSHCKPEFTPVCTSTGLTLPNSCVARCLGFEDGERRFVNGTCSCNNPCASKPCGRRSICVLRPRVCLYTASLRAHCPQYKCVTKFAERLMCPDLFDPVCSTDEIQFNNLCELQKAGKTFSYEGHCLEGCSGREVCGMDGNNYPSECAAMAQRVRMDHWGPCMGCGGPAYVYDNKTDRCSLVQCPPLSSPDCIQYRHEGACCPYCGAAIRITFSQKEVGWWEQSLGKEAERVLTVESVVRSLEEVVRAPGCFMFGQLTLDHDLLVGLTARHPLHQSVCLASGERLQGLIQTRASRLAAILNLSPLLVATNLHAPPDPAPTLTPALLSLLLTYLVFLLG